MGIKVKKLVKAIELTVVAGENGLDREISVEMLSRPGVELAGYLDYFDSARLVLIGSKENSFLDKLSFDVRKERLERILEQKPPGVVFSVNVEISDEFIELGNKYDVPILKSNYRTTPLNSNIYNFLHEKLSPRISVHGVLLDVYGLGVLIIGKSGIGKSEVALELIKRGHILISDDRVDIFEISQGVVVGQAPKILERYIEIRGIGIVDVVWMFGAGSYRENKKIRLIIELEQWNQNTVYDRLGLDNKTVKYFTTDIPKITIPVLPGRTVATLVESAAMNQKLKYFGYNAAEELTKAVSRMTSRKSGEEDDDE